MSNNTMLYKYPGQHEIHGDLFDYLIVDADEEGAIQAALSEGWSMTTESAKDLTLGLVNKGENAKAVVASAADPGVGDVATSGEIVGGPDLATPDKPTQVTGVAHQGKKKGR